MSNVLDLKDAVPREPAPAKSPSMNPPSATVEDPDAEDAFAFDDFTPQEVAWRASAKLEQYEIVRGRYLMGGLAAIATATAYWTGSILLFVIAGLAVMAWEVHHRAHDEHEVEIHKTGIRMNGHNYPFQKLHSFAIHDLPDDSRQLSVKTSSHFSPHLRIPLGDADHEEVRTTLAYHLDEEDHPMPISELFLKS